MRVVSLVPSWTETLIEAGVTVVGRTRFCIHPKDRVKDIPAVGGTKDWNWPEIQALGPDLIVLDREENPKFMAEQSEIPVVDTHVRSLADVAPNLSKLWQATQCEGLKPLISQWEQVAAMEAGRVWDGKSDFPGLLEWGVRPTEPVRQVEYVIWRKPWMVVSRDTFIGSVLAAVGFAPYLKSYPQKYPEIDLAGGPEKSSTLLLFSSEPFPFARISKTLAQLGYPYAIVDGESFSWFGLRALRFLQVSIPSEK